MEENIINSDEDSIRAACTAFAKAMQDMDFKAMEGLWDHNYAHLVYQPEEYETALRSWAGIVDYWSYIPNAVECIPEWRVVETDVALLGDAAIVYCIFITRMQLKGVERALEGAVRFSFGLRRTPEGWQYIHCHESRQLEVNDLEVNDEAPITT